MNSSEIYNFNRHIHTYLIGQIKLSDDKAKSVFTISAGILIYLFNKQQPDLQSLILFDYIGNLGVKIFIYLAIVMLFLSTVLSLKVIYPNLLGSSHGHIFFQSISTFKSSDKYLSEIEKMSANSLNEELIKHNYELSSVISKKYINLNRSFAIGILGFMSMLTYLFILSLSK